MQQSGVVIKTLNSYYYIQCGEDVVRCKIRGRFKKERFSLCVGDYVKFTHQANGDSIVEEILPRRSLLKRPLVANIDQVIVTFAAKEPDLSALLIDRFLVLAEYSNLNVALCINKCDLADCPKLDEFLERYRVIGYPVIMVSAQEKININQIKDILHNKISVITGPSGAGKSTLLNTVEETLALPTGEVSEKLGRGRHTTRVAQLLPLNCGGYVVDTPGFSFTEFTDMDKRDLSSCFVEFATEGGCKFNSCLHDREQYCAVKDGVASGVIHPERYESYLHILNEITIKGKKGF